MNIEQLYRDYNVPFVTDGHKHSRNGWVNTPCPFCTGNPGYHLGFDITDNKFVCWRCGGHYAPHAISKLLRVSINESYKILRQYGVLSVKAPETVRKVKLKSFKLPNNANMLFSNHKKYLYERNFDADFLEKTYKLQGTGPSALLDKINYKHRIIIPYYWNKQIVSFDSRDITNKSDVKYLACPEDREETPRKSILYGKQEAWGTTGICVEGPTDVWRMGFDSFAVSGIKYTPAQVRQIKKHFKRVAVLFDPEPQAIEQANKLVGDLKFRGVDAFRVDIDSDPGDLTQDEANYLLKQIL